MVVRVAVVVAGSYLGDANEGDMPSSSLSSWCSCSKKSQSQRLKSFQPSGDLQVVSNSLPLWGIVKLRKRSRHSRRIDRRSRSCANSRELAAGQSES